MENTDQQVKKNQLMKYSIRRYLANQDPLGHAYFKGLNRTPELKATPLRNPPVPPTITQGKSPERILVMTENYLALNHMDLGFIDILFVLFSL